VQLDNWMERSKSYKCGWVEGREYGDRDTPLMLRVCANDVSEYERGFADGLAERAESEREIQEEQLNAASAARKVGGP